MKCVAIIPARGGSKRLPRKNIAEFLGKPIIAYTIEAALNSEVFERVVVSTEDAEIAEVARHYGAEIAVRHLALSSDTATLREVCSDFLQIELNRGNRYEVFACLLATAPMRSAHDIRSVSELIDLGKCDFSMAVTSYNLPPFQALQANTDNFLEPMWPDLVNLSSQEAPELVVDNGSTYFAASVAFEREHTFYGKGLRGHHMPRERSIDIDDSFDLELARFWAEKLGL